MGRSSRKVIMSSIIAEIVSATAAFDVLLVQVFGKNAMAFRGREDFPQKFQPLAEESARDLPRTRFHIDIAADSMQKERHRVTERIPRIVTERLAIAARRH